VAEKHEPPVIKIIKKGHGHAHHGGAWKVAYADFVTAMMALFIVLWILGQSEDMKRGIGGYFRDPTGKALLGAGPKDANANMSVMQQQHASPQTPVPVNDQAALEALEREAERLREEIAEIPELESLQEQISIEVTAEGIRVEINESEKAPLFESGSSKLSATLSAALDKLAREYQKLNHPVVIEGHTDSQPYSTASSITNWELSTQRANEARQVMVHAGLSESNIFMIRGYSDRRPRFAESSDPRNRRISMLLLSEQGLKIAHGTGYAQPAVLPPPAPAEQPTGKKGGPRVFLGSAKLQGAGH
jgi:chemotaxis protein MotB